MTQLSFSRIQVLKWEEGVHLKYKTVWIAGLIPCIWTGLVRVKYSFKIFTFQLIDA